MFAISNKLDRFRREKSSGLDVVWPCSIVSVDPLLAGQLAFAPETDCVIHHIWDLYQSDQLRVVNPVLRVLILHH